MEWKVELAAIIMLLLGVQLAAAVLVCFLWRSVFAGSEALGFLLHAGVICYAVVIPWNAGCCWRI